MHRNAEIWERRYDRLEAVFKAKAEHFEHARRSPSWNLEAEARRDAWRKRYNAIERRVWHALCVAKGWRRA